ncbi:unnamed protein product [Rangifer tarandus platyrhynchus]|uniref:Uncharacterized protein n=1 Tax=Rangifer tarandus platyrhynchus TaxID=3082113 RepID=A0ABN8XNG7_RANTA|nr:unnamed protein product [Rangifer tarandus platyrhynchus]
MSNLTAFNLRRRLRVFEAQYLQLYVRQLVVLLRSRSMSVPQWDVRVGLAMCTPLYAIQSAQTAVALCELLLILRRFVHDASKASTANTQDHSDSSVPITVHLKCYTAKCYGPRYQPLRRFKLSVRGHVNRNSDDACAQQNWLLVSHNRMLVSHDDASPPRECCDHSSVHVLYRGKGPRLLQASADDPHPRNRVQEAELCTSRQASHVDVTAAQEHVPFIIDERHVPHLLTDTDTAACIRVYETYLLIARNRVSDMPAILRCVRAPIFEPRRMIRSICASRVHGHIRDKTPCGLGIDHLQVLLPKLQCPVSCLPSSMISVPAQAAAAPREPRPSAKFEHPYMVQKKVPDLCSKPPENLLPEATPVAVGRAACQSDSASTAFFATTDLPSCNQTHVRKSYRRMMSRPSGKRSLHASVEAIFVTSLRWHRRKLRIRTPARIVLSFSSRQLEECAPARHFHACMKSSLRSDRHDSSVPVCMAAAQLRHAFLSSVLLAYLKSALAGYKLLRPFEFLHAYVSCMRQAEPARLFGINRFTDFRPAYHTRAVSALDVEGSRLNPWRHKQTPPARSNCHIHTQKPRDAYRLNSHRRSDGGQNASSTCGVGKTVRTGLTTWYHHVQRLMSGASAPRQEMYIVSRSVVPYQLLLRLITAVRIYVIQTRAHLWNQRSHTLPLKAL